MAYGLSMQCEVWDCPFCRENSISVVRLPKSVSVKRNRTASLLGSKEYHVSPDVCLVQTGCSKCGKPQEEVEKKPKQDGLLYVRSDYASQICQHSLADLQ